MPWFRVDDKIGEHPKVRAIPRGKRRNAMGLWVLAGPWCSLNLRDGHVPAFMLDEFCSKPSDAAALVTAGLWHSTGHDCTECPQPRDGDGFVFHDWSSLQYTRAQVMEKRDADAERQRLHRARVLAEREAQSRGGHSVTDTESDTRSAPVQPSRPVPSRPEVSSSLGGERTETPHAPSATEPTCSKHPAGDGGTACGGCAKVRQWRDRAEAEAERQREHARTAALLAEAAEARARAVPRSVALAAVPDSTPRIGVA